VVADCEPLVGGSAAWLIAGLIAMLAGTLLIRFGAARTRHAGANDR
jgi:hypothetical protein